MNSNARNLELVATIGLGVGAVFGLAGTLVSEASLRQLLWAILFAIVATRIFWGEQLLPTSTPLPFFAYPFLVLTFVGWMVALVKGDGVATSSPGAEQPNQAPHPPAPRQDPRNPTRR